MKWMMGLVAVLVVSACGSAATTPTIPEAPPSTVVVAPVSTTVTDGTTTPTTAAPESTVRTTGPAATDDLTGIWDATLDQAITEGPCPAVPIQEGTVVISRVDSTFTMEFSDGFVCRPSAVCEFSGTVAAGTYEATNGGVVDDEGGEYRSVLRFAASTPRTAVGVGTATYTLPDMSCTWDLELTLIRRDG